MLHSIYAILTEATCGEACWEAKEDICRCSCGGKNHGCKRTPNGVQPTRTCKIDGERYELAAVGKRRDLYKDADKVNQSNGFATTYKYGDGGYYHYTWRDTEKGAPARLKYATADQLAKWPELSAYRDARRFDEISLLWVRVEMPPARYCPIDGCERCATMRAQQTQAGQASLPLEVTAPHPVAMPLFA